MRLATSLDPSSLFAGSPASREAAGEPARREARGEHTKLIQEVRGLFPGARVLRHEWNGGDAAA